MSRLTSVSLARAFKGTLKRHLAAAFVGAIIAALLIVPGTLPAAHADNGEPLFELSNGDLDFGELYLGESAVLEATLTNISGTDSDLDAYGWRELFCARVP